MYINKFHYIYIYTDKLYIYNRVTVFSSFIIVIICVI